MQNVDLRYELYPAAGETISVAVFYKHFKNPIEWNYVDAGGSYQFSFENAARPATTASRSISGKALRSSA